MMIPWNGIRVAGLSNLTAYIAVWLMLSNLESTTTSPMCAKECQCLDKGSIVACQSSRLTHIPLIPSTALVLDLDHNHISYMLNGSLHTTPLLEILSLEYNSLVHVDSGVLTHLPELRILRLGHNQLTYVPSNVFKYNRRLEVLDLCHNYLRGPFPDSLISNLHSLQLLNVSYNDLDSAYLGPGFRYAKELHALDLSGNSLVSVESRAFDAAEAWEPGLTHALNLSYCNLHHVHARAFTKLTTVTHLSLQGNPHIPLSELEAALTDLQPSRLTHINLSHMNITDMYNLFRSFQHKNLIELYMNHNSITTIHQRTFFYLENLQVLDLSHNLISDIRDLTGLSRLRYFNLAHNAIQQLDSTAFEGLQDLQVLDFSHNKMTSIDNLPFMDMFSLRTLDISSNLLSEVLLLSGLESLRELRLRDNQISRIDFLKGLPHVQIFDLSNNLITKLGANTFTKGQHFISVNFSDNSIYSIHPKALRGTSTQVLDLSHNHLSSLTDVGWRDVSELHLEHNELYNITSQTFTDLRSSLVSLHLQDNNLHGFTQGTLSHLNRLEYIDLSSNPMAAYLSNHKGLAELNQLRNLKNLHLAKVDLRNLASELFTNLTMLSTLNLSGNSLDNLGSQDQCPFASLQKLQSLDISENLLQNLSPLCLRGPQLERIDFSGNPLSCTCELMPLHNWIISSHHNSTVVHLVDTNSYNCHTPLEWRGVRLVDFYMDNASCSHQEKAIVFAVLGCTVIVIIILVTVAVFRYKLWYRRKLAQTRYSFIQDNNLHGGLGSISMNGSATSTDGSSSTVVSNPRTANTSKDWV